VELPEDTTGAQRHTKRDASLALRPAEAGVVDQVLLTQNEQGQSFVKVRVRTICIPQVSVGVGVRRGSEGGDLR
jgi:DNA-directed RNA polymerase II subunit RPB2